MVKSFRIKTLRITLVFRHKFEKTDDDYPRIRRTHDWKDWKISVWFRKSLLVGNRAKGKDMFKTNNLVNEYMLGIQLLVIKAWITIANNPLTITIKDEQA